MQLKENFKCKRTFPPIIAFELKLKRNAIVEKSATASVKLSKKS